MENIQTHQDLKNQVAELKKQNEILRLITSFQKDGEKGSLKFSDIKDLAKNSGKYTSTILNSMGDSVFVKDDQSKFILVNDSFCELFKLSRDEIIGKTLEVNFPKNERESFMSIDRQVIINGIENLNEEPLTILGETKIISTRKSRFIDANGAKFLVGVIRDVSQKKKEEEALKESETRFRELNATKDKLFSIIAHDLRGPFNNIIGLSGLLQKNTRDSEDIQPEKYINIINSTAKSTLILLDNLLNWANSQTGELKIRSKEIVLSNVIHDIIGLKKPLAKGKNISLLYTPKKEIRINTDENILKTILRNLISNAIKFTKSGGRINILTTLNQHNVEISVFDSGVGMSEETIQKLFDISTNVSIPGTENEKGSGLGLVLSKEFVNKLGGHIWVESEIGKGSNFTFSLPLNISGN